MKCLFALLTSISLSACGVTPVHSGDEDLLPYLTQFQKAAQSVGKSPTFPPLEMKLVKKLPPEAPAGSRGFCGLSGEKPKVSILKSFWSSATESLKEQIAFHELGHCVLHRGHLDLRVPITNMPISIMNSQGIEDSTYISNRSQYLMELFWNN